MKRKTAVEETAALAIVEPEGVEPESVEVMAGDPKWDRARKFMGEVKSAFMRSIDAQILLGGELKRLKSELGYDKRGGDRKSNRQLAGLIEPRRTWEQWCQAELGLSERTAYRFIKCFELIQRRADALGEDSPACRLLATPAKEMTESEYKKASEFLHHLIRQHSQEELLQDFRMLRQPTTGKKGGDTSEARRKNLAKMDGVIAAKFLKRELSHLQDAGKKITQFKRRQDLERWLFESDLVADSNFMGLLNYRATLAQVLEYAIDDMKAILKTVDRFITAKREAEAAMVRKVKFNARHIKS